MMKKSDFLLIAIILGVFASFVFIKPVFTTLAVIEGTNTRLEIYDQTNTTIIYPGETINFYANYSNLTDNSSINASCNITFEDSADNAMTYDSGLYIYNRSFSSNGTFYYNVTCANESYETLTAEENAFVTETPNYCIGTNFNFTCGDSVNESCVLNGNLTVNGTCFTIDTNDIILDCNNNLILGITNNSVGINILAVNNTIVKNCIIIGNLSDTKANILEGVRGIVGNGNTSVYDSIFINNSRGIRFESFTTGANITNNTFINGEVAIILWGIYGANYERITVANNNATNQNTSYFYNDVVTLRNIMENLFVYNNKITSGTNPPNIELYQVDHAEIYNNTLIAGTQHMNIWLGYNSQYNHIFNNTIINGTDGIIITGASFNFIEGNTFLTQIHHPMIILTYGFFNSTNNTIFNNTMLNPLYYGIPIGGYPDPGYHPPRMAVSGTNISGNFIDGARIAVYTGYLGGLDYGTIIENNHIINSRESAIRLPNSLTSGNIITGNLIENNPLGVYVSGSYDNKIINNTFRNNGGSITSSSGLTNIENNTFFNNSGNYVLDLNGVSNLIIAGNNFDSNDKGIRLSYSGNNIVLANNSINNTHYINFDLFQNDFSGYNQIDTSNTINGNPIYYIYNQSNVEYENSTNASLIYIINSNNISIGGANIEKNQYGIFLWGTNNSIISNSKSINNYNNLYFRFSYNNFIYDSNISNSSSVDIYSESSQNSNITLVNTTHGNNSLADALLYMQWYLNLFVKDSTRNIANATVNVTGSGNLIFNEITNSTGHIPRQILAHYYANSTYIYYFPAYLVTALAEGYYTKLKSITIDSNKNDYVVLSAVGSDSGSSDSGSSGGGIAPYIVKTKNEITEEPVKEKPKEIIQEIPKEEPIPPVEEKPEPTVYETEQKNYNMLILIAVIIAIVLASFFIIFAALKRRKPKQEKIQEAKKEFKYVPEKKVYFEPLKEQPKPEIDRFRIGIEELNKKIEAIKRRLKEV